METISLTKLHDILDGIKKPTFINMITVTPVKMAKTNNPYFDKIFKVKNGNYMIGTNYEKRVNNNLNKEQKTPNFHAEKSNVGNHVSTVRLYNENTKKSYLQHERFENTIIQTKYLFEGNEIELSKFEGFMPKPSNYQNQNLNKTVNILSVTTSNIKKITINGKEYLIV